jgi:hypothetical protein
VFVHQFVRPLRASGAIVPDWAETFRLMHG